MFIHIHLVWSGKTCNSTQSNQNNHHSTATATALLTEIDEVVMMERQADKCSTGKAYQHSTAVLAAIVCWASRLAGCSV